ncbi:MAG: tRNA (N(6)-L-threonylcarbamoyladenosine(37)-C(2))-methylthiotransferase MtaB [Terriglobales bacterium]
MASFYIENFGCRATQADGAALERQFLERGLERAHLARDAEIVVLNTCTVTAGADKDARASIRRLQRVNPDCRILVTGCYAQRAPEELAALPGVTWVVGNSHKHQVAEIATGSSSSSLSSPSPSSSSSSALSAGGFFSLARLAAGAEVVVGDIFAHTELMAAPVFEAANERTRPNLKIQDGCDNRCSFCVIPYVRGQSRSLPEERVLAEVRTLVEAGYREVVISGINLGRWGRDLEISPQFPVSSAQSGQNSQLVDLIRAILSATSLEKLRISSVEPMDWSDELIELVAASTRIAKHAHVPMQSGSDAVLRRMHRKYRPWHYREKILKIRAAMPRAAIGADVMVGFPGETEAEFAETRRMVEELPFTYLHVFTYSARPGTPAADQPEQVPVSLARERNAVLREIASAKKAAFLRSLVGREVEAITLQSGGGDGSTEALTENYLKAKVEGDIEANRWIRLQVKGIDGDRLAGVVSPVVASPMNARREEILAF